MSHLFSGLEIGFGQDLDERADNMGVYDGLDLFLVAGGNIGNGPARLFLDCRFRVFE